LVATSLLRANARPRKPIAVKIAPAIISQCGNSIDESRPSYFPFAFSPLLDASSPASSNRGTPRSADYLQAGKVLAFRWHIISQLLPIAYRMQSAAHVCEL
jgi:hypothetical protein